MAAITPMAAMTVVLVGLVATAVMFALQFMGKRFGILRGSLVMAAGSLVFPDAIKSTVKRTAILLCAGLVFAVAYMSIFRLVLPRDLHQFMKIGGALGLVHGFFVSFFVMLDTSSLKADRYELKGAILNILMHVVFGVMLGLGAGFVAGGGNVVWYSAFALILAATVAGLTAVLTPKEPRRLHFRGFHWAKARGLPKWSPATTRLANATSPVRSNRE